MLTTSVRQHSLSRKHTRCLSCLAKLPVVTPPFCDELMAQSDQAFSARYSAVEKELHRTPPYEDVLFLNDFAPEEKVARWRYRHEFCRPFAAEVCSYSGGDNQCTLYWVWISLPDPADSDTLATTRIIADINKRLKVCKLAVLPGARLHKLALHYSRVAEQSHPGTCFSGLSVMATH